MVYCGKPSMACAECRLRRTKCDTLKPSCSQCVRAGRVCRGYRDPSEMMFRDESLALSAKRQRSASAKKSRPGSELPHKETDLINARLSRAGAKPQVNRTNPSPVSFPALDLSTSAEEQATSFFFRNYVLEEQKYHNGHFQYLSDIYAREEIGESLADSVVCLGLVGLANFWKASNILISAKAKYNSALRLVSSKLRNIEEAKSDQTMAAVMLLGVYETNTCTSPQSMDSWTKHINGATALLTLRGKKQLKSRIGHNLFTHLRTQVLTSCIQRKVPVPSIIREWSQAALEYETPEETISTYLCQIAVKYCDLRSSMSSFWDYSNSEYLITRLLALEAEYTDLLGRCPIPFLYTTVTLEEPSDEVFGDYYHVYSSIWSASVWNWYRCVRILVNEILIDQMSHVLQHPEEYPSSWDKVSLYQNQIVTSNATLTQLSRDICASVPFFLGYSVKSSDRASRPPPKAVSGSLLLWPLYIAACTFLVSDELLGWVAGRLRMIADVMGIRQAVPLAHTLRLKQDLLEWKSEAADEESSVIDSE